MTIYYLIVVQIENICRRLQAITMSISITNLFPDSSYTYSIPGTSHLLHSHAPCLLGFFITATTYRTTQLPPGSAAQLSQSRGGCRRGGRGRGSPAPRPPPGMPKIQCPPICTEMCKKITYQPRILVLLEKRTKWIYQRHLITTCNKILFTFFRASVIHLSL